MVERTRSWKVVLVVRARISTLCAEHVVMAAPNFVAPTRQWGNRERAVEGYGVRERLHERANVRARDNEVVLNRRFLARQVLRREFKREELFVLARGVVQRPQANLLKPIPLRLSTTTVERVRRVHGVRFNVIPDAVFSIHPLHEVSVTVHEESKRQRANRERRTGRRQRRTRLQHSRLRRRSRGDI